MNIGYFDIVLFVVILSSSLLAFNKGFIKSVLSLVGWVLSIVFTYTFFPHLEPILLKHMPQLSASIVGYGSTLLLSLLFFALLSYAICIILKKFWGGYVDKYLGGLFGIMRGYIICVVLLTAITTTLSILNGPTATDQSLTIEQMEKQMIPGFISSSTIYPALLVGRDFLISYIPDSVYQSFTPHTPTNNLNTKLHHDIYKSTKILSKHIDEKSLQEINKQTEEIPNISELERKVNILQLLLDLYVQQYNSKKIPENKAISQEELDGIRHTLQYAKTEIAHNKSSDIIDQIIENSATKQQSNISK